MASGTRRQGVMSGATLCRTPARPTRPAAGSPPDAGAAGIAGCATLARSMRKVTWNGVALAVGVVALALGGPWLLRQVRSLPGEEALAARAGQRIVTLEVGGMTCGACAAKVHGELASVPGVSAVAVRLKQDRAYVVCSPALPDSALISAVRRAGPGFVAAIFEP